MRTQPVAYKKYNPTFGVNLQSPKLKFNREDFFVNIRGYGKNNAWADIVRDTADTAVELIRKKMKANQLFKFIAVGIMTANQKTLDIAKRALTGILRIPYAGWDNKDDWEDGILITTYGTKGNAKYSGYENRLDEKMVAPLSNPFKDIDLTRPVEYNDKKVLVHGDKYSLYDALKHVEKLYNSISENYIGKDITGKDLADINDKIAESRWVLAHATPWLRGSDAISNVYMRAIYKSLGIKSYPIAKGISLDMEAYCTELEDYKKNFPKYFEQEPVIIE